MTVTRKQFEAAMKRCLKNGCFRSVDVVTDLGLTTHFQKIKIRRFIEYMRKTNRLQRIESGYYRLVSHTEVTDRDKIWSIIRARWQFSYETLEELTGVSRGKIAYYVCLLKSYGYVKRIRAGRNPAYQLIKDQVERPKLTEKNKLRRKKS